MNVITTDTLMELLPSILFFFAVGTLGAFTKNTYETMTRGVNKIRIGEVLIGGIVTTIICIGLSDTVFKNFSLNLMAFITFVLGVLGFEIFGNMTSIDRIRNLLHVIDEVRKGVPPNESSATLRSEESSNESVAPTNDRTGRGDSALNSEPEIEIMRDEQGNYYVNVPDGLEVEVRRVDENQ